MKYLFGIFAILFFCLGCKSESDNQTRAYVEGKVVSNFGSEEIMIKLISENVSIAEVKPDNSGNFVLSAPLLNYEHGYSVKLNKKIKSYSTSETNLKLSADSLEILIPAGNSYVKFNEINLNP